MDETELNRIVEAKLAAALTARLEADRARVRTEVIMQIRREAERAWYDRINSRAPIQDKYGGLTREQHEARTRDMRRRAAEDMASMDASEARGRERVAAMRQPRASISPGSEGFEIKRGGA